MTISITKLRIIALSNNNTQHKEPLYKDTNHNDTQYNDIQSIDTQHNDTQKYIT